MFPRPKYFSLVLINLPVNTVGAKLTAAAGAKATEQSFEWSSCWDPPGPLVVPSSALCTLFVMRGTLQSARDYHQGPVISMSS